MNVDKAKKRIAKQVKKGFNGYPQISLTYFGKSADSASEVLISFVLDEGEASQEQKFTCEQDAREDETIQSILVKIIERADAKTVIESDGVSIIS
ncbi:hypothetical protein [Zhongshania borealis]|uniref:Uncharacterized protein n=1 Tax=Zhongshania borealis TaxID=889488 RepID=A0ABP7WXI4_9GAMM